MPTVGFRQVAPDDSDETRAAIDVARETYLRWVALTRDSLEAVDRLPNAEVRQQADEVLRLAEHYRDDWNYGNAIHKGNLALGQIALREGDLTAARDFLRKAGETPGSPQLNSFGPNMTLAKELFERGERQAILEYFVLCGEFWDEGETLRRWSEEVRSGIEPDFGANLRY